MNAPIRTADTTGASPVAIRPKFVHLKVHSAYSLLEGALVIAKLAKLAAAAGMPALGLTDTNNMFGALEFSDKVASVGVQPITGVSLAIDFCDARKDDALRKGTIQPGNPHRDGLIALYAMNEAGYANLMKLASRAHLGTSDIEPGLFTGLNAPVLNLADGPGVPANATPFPFDPNGAAFAKSAVLGDLVFNTPITTELYKALQSAQFPISSPC